MYAFVLIILFLLFISAYFTMTLPLGKTTVGVGNNVKYNVVVDNPDTSGYNSSTGVLGFNQLQLDLEVDLVFTRCLCP